MLDLASILASISFSGWTVYHIGQLSPSLWTASLTQRHLDETVFTPDAFGPDILSALQAAYDSIPRAQGYSHAIAIEPAPAFSLASLGLTPKPTFNSPLRRGKL